ncbi:MAG: hypothetical protein C4575_01620 [Desulforudis sp.]|nr:MAG: hypothetical protein C4575_01620 [Desulforudis sp.]
MSVKQMAGQMPADNQQELRRIATEKLRLAKRFCELTAEQRAVISALPSEEAFVRMDALVKERQRCMDEFDRLSELATNLAIIESKATDGELRAISDELKTVLRDAAKLDTANKEALLAQREAMLKLIEQLKQGKQALGAYGRQGGSEAAFVDKNK